MAGKLASHQCGSCMQAGGEAASTLRVCLRSLTWSNSFSKGNSQLGYYGRILS